MGSSVRWDDGETIAALGDLTAGIGEAQMDGWMDRRGSGVDVESRGSEEEWLLGRGERRGEEDVGMDGRGWDVAEGAWFE